jgi:hypothetical protein
MTTPANTPATMAARKSTNQPAATPPATTPARKSTTTPAARTR